MRGTAKPLPPPLYAQRGTGARIRPGGVQKIRYGLPGVSRKLGTGTGAGRLSNTPRTLQIPRASKRTPYNFQGAQKVGNAAGIDGQVVTSGGTEV